MKRAKKYTPVKDGEWVQPVLKGYKMRCCDCGLVHLIDFKILEDEKGKFLKFRARRLGFGKESLKQELIDWAEGQKKNAPWPENNYPDNSEWDAALDSLIKYLKD